MIPFDSQLLSITDEAAEITAHECRKCGSTTLVTSVRCAVCQGPTDNVTISGGTVLYLCEARFPVHGFAPPVQIAQVRCEPLIDIVGVCIERVDVGDAVTLVQIPVENRDGESAGYAFRHAAPNDQERRGEAVAEARKESARV